MRRLLAVALMLAGCGKSPAETTPPQAAAVDCKRLVFTGEATATTPARWTYHSTDQGVTYSLEGILFVPEGPGPHPAVLISHGAGGSPNNYSAGVGRIMRTWGLVVIATRYTHAGDADGRNASLSPAGELGASEANVQRAMKTRALLSCIGNVDTTRLAAHGHSMGAFVTGELVGTHSNAFRAASHTAGGTGAGLYATKVATVERIRTPYQLHHGDADRVVDIRQDEAFAQALQRNGATHEFHRYPGYAHDQITTDPQMLERVRGWYTRWGVLR